MKSTTAKDTYKITAYPGLGLAISGIAPISAMLAAMKWAEKLMGCTGDQLFDDLQLSRRLGALAVFGTTESLAKWKEELDKAPVKQTTGIPWLDGWLDRGEVGISSASIASACFGLSMARVGMAAWPDGRLPADAPDFTRCRKLVDLAAENGEDLLARLKEVPMWAPLVARWADLCAAEKDYAACTAILKEIRNARS